MMIDGTIHARGSSQFQQRQANEAKLGAYYTDPDHCERIHKLFSFSTEEETSVLEPSIGNGLAVRLATDAEHNEKVRIFGVEINAEVAEQQQENPVYESILKADFLSEVFITNSSFSMVFANPPYMEDNSYENTVGTRMSRRTEFLFLEKCTNYLKSGGILCWIIPYRIFIEDSYIGFMMSRYKLLKVYKMDDKEFAKWGQVVVVAEKRPCSTGILKDDRMKMQAALTLENIGYLPSQVEDSEKIAVPPSEASKVANFRTIVFDAKAAQAWVDQHPEVLDQLNAHIRARTGIKRKTDTVYTPPKEPSMASISLLAACGIGNGLVGSVEAGTLHLQRGSVKIEKQVTVDEKDNSDGTKTAIMTERSFSVTRQILIETNGTIRDLTKKDEDAELVS